MALWFAAAAAACLSLKYCLMAQTVSYKNRQKKKKNWGGGQTHTRKTGGAKIECPETPAENLAGRQAKVLAS